MHRVRVITFDAGGTLLFPYPSVGEIYSEVAREHGAEVSAERIEAAFRRVWQESDFPSCPHTEAGEKAWWQEVVRATHQGLPTPEDFDTYFDELWHSFADPHRWRLADDAIDTLSDLKDRGFRLGLLSNWDSRLRHILDGLDLCQWFEHVIISSEVGCEKPEPEIFALTRERFDADETEILHIGDSPHHDVMGATTAGWHVLQLGHSGLTGDGAGIIDRLSEVPERLRDTHV